MAKANLSPRFDRHDGWLKDKPATPLNNWYDAMALLRATTLLAPERMCSPVAKGWSILPQARVQPQARAMAMAMRLAEARQNPRWRLSAPQERSPPLRLAAGRPD